MAQVKTSLTAALTCVQDGLNALKSDTAKSGLETQPAVEVVRKDLISIISLIYSYSTRLWIALGKQPPTPSAAIPTLQDITNHVRSLYGCAIFFRDMEGKTLAAEVHTTATDILLAMQALLQGYSTQQHGEDLMRKTGALHEACERGKNLSVDNREAVLKIWKQDGDAVKDAIKELNALLSPQPADADLDGWDELLGEEAGGTELSEGEIGTIKKALGVLERISSFRKQIQKTILSAGNADFATRYDRVLEASREMIPMVDDAVACLDTSPLEVEECRSILAELCKSSRNLLKMCSETPDEISEALAKLDIGPHQGSIPDKAHIASLVATVDEIARTIQSI